MRISSSIAVGLLVTLAGCATNQKVGEKGWFTAWGMSQTQSRSNIQGSLPQKPAPVTRWSMIGSGCTPYQIYIAGDTYYNAGGAVVVKEKASAVFNCPVTLEPSLSSPSQLTVVNSGATTSPSGAHTTAALIAMSLSTGQETVIATVTATSSGSVHSTSTLFTHAFNQDLNFYYVRVTMTSGAVPGQIQTLFGVALAGFAANP